MIPRTYRSRCRKALPLSAAILFLFFFIPLQRIACSEIIELATAKAVYVQPEPIFIACTLRGLEAGTPVDLTVTLEYPDGRLAFMGTNGIFSTVNPIWLLENWGFFPLSIHDGQWALVPHPDNPLTPGRYVLRGEVYYSVTSTLIDHSESEFFLVDAPYLDHADPAMGITGDVIALHGIGFGTVPELVKIVIGGREATIIDISDTIIHTWIPYGAVTGDATVTVDGAVSNPIGFLVGPYIEKVSKTVVEPGSTLDIEGFNFDLDINRNYVDFNGIRGTVKTATATKLKVLVPEGNTGPLTVQVNQMESGPQQITVTPVADSVFPERGEPGEVVTIAGRNFSPLLTNNYVVFNAGSDDEVAATILEASVTQLVVRVPPAETGDLSVYADGQEALGDLVFTYPPEIDEITPVEVVAGDSLTITGRNFHDTEARNTVTLAGETLTISSALPHTITARTSTASYSGTLSVTVNGLSNLGSPFVSVYPSLVLRTASPTSLAATDTSTQIEVTGIGFKSGLTLTLSGPGGAHTASVTIAAYDQLSFKLPRGLSPGSYQLSVSRTVAGRPKTSNTLQILLQ
jgi:hypothetical protein